MTAYPPPKAGYVPPDAEETQTLLPRGLMRWDVISTLVHQNRWISGIEVGCADGRTTDRILKACPNLIMSMVDTWSPNEKGILEDWSQWPHEENKEKAYAVGQKYKGRCAVYHMSSREASYMFEPNSFDFVFLDADHNEKAVREDIMSWLSTIRRGGAILGHDINWPSVRSAVEALIPRYWIAGNNVWGAMI